MIKKMGITWNLRKLMAAVTCSDHDLVPLLADAGSTCLASRSSGWSHSPTAAINGQPSPRWCDILECTPNDLIEIQAVNAQVSRPQADTRSPAPQVRRTRTAARAS